MIEPSSWSSRTYQTGQLYKAAYDKMMGNTHSCAKVVNFLAKGFLLALFVIGCVGAAQVISGQIVGWVAVGLGVGFFATKLLAGEFHKRKVDIGTSALAAALLVIFGIFGGAGVFSASQVGGALIGGVASIIFISSCLMIAAKRLEEKRIREKEDLQGGSEMIDLEPEIEIEIETIE